jgi:predicted ATPase
MFVIPDQLYGRAGKMATLVRLWRRTARGELQLCLVHGEAGMGKTALARALRDTVLGSGDKLVEGRFEARQREQPYAGLVDAFRTLLRQVLAEAQAERARWRKRLLGALGNNLAVVQEVLPELEWITGRQAPAPLLVGLAAQQRMDAAFMELLVLFAGPEHPLLLFLYDLQRADRASLTLLRTLLRERRSSHLLILVTCQDMPTRADSPLARLLCKLKPSHASLTEIRLAPLPAEEVAALTSLVMQQTRGNPRDARLFLQNLVTQGRLRYEPLSNGWTWTPGDTSAAPATLWWI